MGEKEGTTCIYVCNEIRVLYVANAIFFFFLFRLSSKLTASFYRLSSDLVTLSDRVRERASEREIEREHTNTLTPAHSGTRSTRIVAQTQRHSTLTHTHTYACVLGRRYTVRWLPCVQHSFRMVLLPYVKMQVSSNQATRIVDRMAFVACTLNSTGYTLHTFNVLPAVHIRNTERFYCSLRPLFLYFSRFGWTIPCFIFEYLLEYASLTHTHTHTHPSRQQFREILLCGRLFGETAHHHRIERNFATRKQCHFSITLRTVVQNRLLCVYA